MIVFYSSLYAFEFPIRISTSSSPAELITTKEVCVAASKVNLKKVGALDVNFITFLRPISTSKMLFPTL